MSVTPPVSHVEMWPYAASAAVASASHAATASRIVVSSRGKDDWSLTYKSRLWCAPSQPFRTAELCSWQSPASYSPSPP